jgi:dTDP-4-amino-4,6-dideoxygalactose transaminase
MHSITDYKNPYDAILEFENKIAEYTGAPYCITTDCCTHAIEIAFRLRHNEVSVEFPAHTYLSVLMTMHKLQVTYTLTDEVWKEQYQFIGTNIYDSARLFKENMYVPNTIQCLSFGHTKPLQVGCGGCILTDDKDFYQHASKMRMDGRDIFQYNPWITQGEFELGFHYYMRPEECIKGINMLENKEFTEQEERFYNYPDCRKIVIK